MTLNIFGVGTDIVKNSRIKKLIKNKKFINRIFTSSEIKDSKKKSGKPYLTLSNKLKNILKRKLKLKKVKIFLSLSDEREYSVAYVITQKIK